MTSICATQQTVEQCLAEWPHTRLSLGGAPDAGSARRQAEAAALRTLGEAMLVAWYERKTGSGYPDVPECTGKPGWFAYGLGHSASLLIEVGDGDWLFLYAPLNRN